MTAEVIYQVRTYFDCYVNVSLQEFNYARKMAKKGSYVIEVDKSYSCLWVVQLAPNFKSI